VFYAVVIRKSDRFKVVVKTTLKQILQKNGEAKTLGKDVMSSVRYCCNTQSKTNKAQNLAAMANSV